MIYLKTGKRQLSISLVFELFQGEKLIIIQINVKSEITGLLWLISGLLWRALGVLPGRFGGLWRGGGRPARAAARGGGGWCGAAPLAPGDGVCRRRLVGGGGGGGGRSLATLQGLLGVGGQRQGRCPA